MFKYQNYCQLPSKLPISRTGACVFPEQKFLERIFLERVFPEKIILEMNFPRIKNSLNITIIGCGYVGYAVAQYWQQNQNFVVTATTTTPRANAS